jgi:hypothetical protein
MRHGVAVTNPSKGAIAGGINLLEQEPEWTGKYHSVTIVREIK